MPVSSSYVRRLLHEGDLETTRAFLGRPWQITGSVVPGAGRGKTLGYPTVNIDTDNDLLIPDGVYGGRIHMEDGTCRTAAISVGTNPTFGEEPRHAEAFVLDFQDGEIAGEIRLEFWSYVRAQITFTDAARLIKQMEADVDLIRRTAERQGWLEAGG